MVRTADPTALPNMVRTADPTNLIVQEVRGKRKGWDSRNVMNSGA